MKTYFVKPANGLLILDPNTYKPIPDTGVEVPATQYWVVMIRDGDVLVVDPITPAFNTTSAPVFSADSTTI